MTEFLINNFQGIQSFLFSSVTGIIVWVFSRSKRERDIRAKDAEILRITAQVESVKIDNEGKELDHLKEIIDSQDEYIKRLEKRMMEMQVQFEQSQKSLESHFELKCKMMENEISILKKKILN